jgi:hypothetical protein
VAAAAAASPVKSWWCSSRPETAPRDVLAASQRPHTHSQRTVCRPVISILSSLGPMDTLTLCAARQRRVVQANRRGVSADHPRPPRCEDWRLQASPGPSSHVHVVEEVGPPPSALEGLHRAAEAKVLVDVGVERWRSLSLGPARRVQPR